MLLYAFLFLLGILFNIYLQLHMYAKKILAHHIEKSDVLLLVRYSFLAHQIEKSDALPCVRNLLSYTTYLARGPCLVT